MDALDPLTAGVMRSPPRGLNAGYFRAASDFRELLAGMVNSVDESLFLAFTLVFFFCLIRMIVGRDWIAETAFAGASSVQLIGTWAAPVTKSGLSSDIRREKRCI